MAKQNIKQPRNATIAIKVKKNGVMVTTELDFKYAQNFSSLRTEQFQRAQEMFDIDVMRTLQPYIPLDSGTMDESMILATEAGSGEIKVDTPYAAMVNYLTGVMGKNGPLRGRRFFDRMKADKLEYFKGFVAKLLGANAK